MLSEVISYGSPNILESIILMMILHPDQCPEDLALMSESEKLTSGLDYLLD